MNRLSVLVVLCTFVAVLSDTAQGQYGNQPPSMPPPVVLNVPQVMQDTFVWCWLANAEMVIKYRRNGIAPRQCEMMELGYQMPPGTCCGQEMNCTRPSSGMRELQSVLGYIGGVFSAWTPPQDPMLLYRKFLNDIPIIAQVRLSAMGTHVVVLRGMRFESRVVMNPYTGTPMLQVIPIVLVNDPLSLLAQEIPYTQLLSVWIDSLEIGNNWRRQSTSPRPSPDFEETRKQSPPKQSDDVLCRSLLRVIVSTPSLATVTGEPRAEDKRSDRYNGTIVIPGTSDCYVERWDSKPADYVCKVDLSGDECGAAEKVVRELGSKIRSCLPRWWHTEERTAPAFTQRIARSKDDGPIVTIAVDKLDAHCSGFLEITSQ